MHRDYEELCRILSRSIPTSRLIRDPLRTFAYGTDASFYRLIPQVVVRVQSEAELIAVVQACANLKIPYTFRAAGTSLSGQALSDSVLIQISRLWNGIHLNTEGTIARLQPAVLGGEANRALVPFQRKIGPDPASIDSAMIGGIAANNASGMCCGNVQDTYHTMSSLRVIFADGSTLDTGSQESRQRFLLERSDLVEKIKDLSVRIKENHQLTQRIRKKYLIKNTTGYSLHVFIDFDDPIEIIAHLLVGSEGTLGFISEITYNTVTDAPYRATSLVLFHDMHAACEAANLLSGTGIAAVELMDRQSLRAVENKPGIPSNFKTLPDGVTALLVEARADLPEGLEELVSQVQTTLEGCRTLQTAFFTEDKLQAKQLWDIRKGLFPSLGYSRQTGTTIIIEDVAFPLNRLADAATDLRNLFLQHEYHDAVIFGHALQGNLHFVFCVDFNMAAEVFKYRNFLEDLTRLVTQKYDGSLKAEHGTGRNMAPFVELEWGAEAYAIMREIKHIFDPDFLLNPDVILSADPDVHVSNLKHTPQSHSEIEKCTECGFCERTCPSVNLSLSPRQRITVWREISRLAAIGADKNRLHQLQKDFNYAGNETCAVDSLCATLCPLGIDTGAFIKDVRNSKNSRAANFLANIVAENFSSVVFASHLALGGANIAHRLFGTRGMKRITGAARKISFNRIPAWNSWIPVPSSHNYHHGGGRDSEKVVYFPSCVSRLFGASQQSPYPDSQNVRITNLLKKSGYEVLYPNNLEDLCCGMAFSSKGYSAQGDRKAKQLSNALDVISKGGKYPIVLDTSPCAQRLKSYPAKESLRLFDVTDFLLNAVISRLEIKKMRTNVAVHVPCSLRKAGQGHNLIGLAKLCAESIFESSSTPCCGFAGDRGFTHPELPASALISLKASLPADCRVGFSSSRTCEIGVSQHSGISYQSIAYLVDECTK